MERRGGDNIKPTDRPVYSSKLEPKRSSGQKKKKKTKGRQDKVDRLSLFRVQAFGGEKTSGYIVAERTVN